MRSNVNFSLTDLLLTRMPSDYSYTQADNSVVVATDSGRFHTSPSILRIFVLINTLLAPQSKT